ncbi:histone H3.v1 isoform X2 [Diabrotica virgifera virgifera]|uniref:Histone H3.v1-like isoform X2 n=1 Tax=Diabrotica virgifera virgifera TaxID=50390 RepID=A0A6P7G0Q7_DIAVI|nr:histone H3.v1 isoform X2 [Diabrotica virgifera virgifera]
MGRRKRSSVESLSLDQSENYIKMEIDNQALRGKNKVLAQTVAKIQQEKALFQKQVTHLQEEYFALNSKYVNLRNIFSRIESTTKNSCFPRIAEAVNDMAQIMHLCALGSLVNGAGKDPKTLSVKPHTVNGTVIQNPTITLSRFNDLDLESSRSTSSNSSRPNFARNSIPTGMSMNRTSGSPSTSRASEENPVENSPNSPLLNSPDYISFSRRSSRRNVVSDSGPNTTVDENEEENSRIDFVSRCRRRNALSLPREHVPEEEHEEFDFSSNLAMEEEDDELNEEDVENNEENNYSQRLMTIEEVDETDPSMISNHPSMVSNRSMVSNPSMESNHPSMVSNHPSMVSNHSSMVSNHPSMVSNHPSMVSNSSMVSNPSPIRDRIREIRIYLSPLGPEYINRIQNTTQQSLLGSPSSLSGEVSNSILDENNTFLSGSPGQTKFASPTLNDFSFLSPSSTASEFFNKDRSDWSKTEAENDTTYRPSASTVDWSEDSTTLERTLIPVPEQTNLEQTVLKSDSITTSTPVVPTPPSRVRRKRKKKSSEISVPNSSPLSTLITKRKNGGEKMAQVLIKRMNLSTSTSPVKTISESLDTVPITDVKQIKQRKTSKAKPKSKGSPSKVKATNTEKQTSKETVKKKTKGKENRKLSPMQIPKSPRLKRASKPLLLKEPSLQKKLRRSR